MNAETLMMIGGLGAFLLTVYWVRSRDLRERYAIGWLGMAVLLLICGLFPELIKSLARTSQLSYPSAVLFISLAAMYFFSFFVTVSLTRQYRRNVRLMQETAILRHRLETIEARIARGSEDDVEADASE
jgi:hypothetical protein